VMWTQLLKLDSIPMMWREHTAHTICLTPLVYALLADKSGYALKALMLMIGVLVLIDWKSSKAVDVEHTRSATKDT